MSRPRAQTTAILAGACVVATSALAQQPASRPSSQPPRPETNMPFPQDRGRDREAPELSQERRVLQSLEGMWRVDVEMLGGDLPQSTPEPAFAMRRWVLDGTFLQERQMPRRDVEVGGARGERRAARVPGMAFFGYDQEQQRYNAAWLDSGTGAIHAATGTYDEQNRVFTFEAPPHASAAAAGHGQTTIKLSILDDSRHMIELFEGAVTDPPAYRITYTRAEPGGPDFPGRGDDDADRPGQRPRPRGPGGQGPGTPPPR